VTEEIYQNLPGNDGFIMRSEYPEFNEDEKFEEEVESMNIVMEVINSLRNIRGEMNISPSLEIKAYYTSSDERLIDVVKTNARMIKVMAKLAEFDFVFAEDRPKKAAVAVIKGMELTVPVEGIIDFEEEEKRLLKEIEKVDKDWVFLNKKLSNEKFIQNAPPDIVKKERDKLNESILKKEKLGDSLNRLSLLKG
jgi:valyl-tRNA synthetase